jgi:transcriptional regulator with XRE-family HTH domain
MEDDVPHIGPVLGRNIRAQRQLRNWTQEQLADAVAPFLGPTWDQRLVAVVEKGEGRRLLASELLALASVLEVDIWKLATPLAGDRVRLGGGEPLRAAPPEVDRDRLLDAHWVLGGSRHQLRGLVTRLQAAKHEAAAAASSGDRASEMIADIESEARAVLGDLESVSTHLDGAEGADRG